MRPWLSIRQGLVLLAMVCWNVAARAQAGPDAPVAGDYCIEVWDAERGLPQNAVTTVVQTRDGYLWVGTYTGLARFDGVRFTVFDSTYTPGLSNSRITSLYEDRQGCLWVGHETGDLSRLIDGRFSAVVSSAQWSGRSIVTIGESGDGDVWVADVLGRLLRVDDCSVVNPGQSAGSAWESSSLAVDGTGRLFLAAGARLSEVRPDGLHPLTMGGEPVVTSCELIASGRDGGLWVIGDGLIRKWKAGSWVVDLGAPPWEGGEANAMLETSTGRLLVGTLNHGLYAFTPGADPQHWARAQGLPHDWVRSLFEDREGNLWAGTSGGLAALRHRKVFMRSPADDWQGRAVLGITSSRDGAIWAGTEGAGLYRFLGGDWSRFGAEHGLTNLFIWSVLQDRQGAMWAGAWGGGLRVLQDGRFRQPKPFADRPAVVTALALARDGSLLIGTSAGLMRFRDGRADWLTPTNEPAAPDVRAIAETRDGAIWFGTSGSGLGRILGDEVEVFHEMDGLPSEFIMSLLSDSDGTLWIGTLHSGLGYWRAGRFGMIGVEAGLPSALICSLQDDGLGCLWVSSQNGIFRVAKSALVDYAQGRASSVFCLSYGKPEGMATVVCATGFQPSGCRTVDGRIWFPTPKGLAAVDPSQVSRNPVVPPVIIEEVRVDDRLAPMDVDQAVLEQGGSVPLIVVSPGRHRFEFRYTGLSFSAPDRVRFRTRLEGIEEEWSPPVEQRSVNFNYLPHGRYTFRVIACNNDGVWNDTGAAIVLRLLPHFWQTLWFQGSMVLIGSVGISVGVRFVTRRRMRRKLEQVERQQAMERERARIARDIHDDLGASLTRITMLSHTAHEELEPSSPGVDYVDQIYRTSREVTRAMDEIVWAVDPHHDTLDSLVTYLGRFAQQFLSSAGVRCRLDVPAQLPAWPLTSEVRHNLFLALKEGLNNVLRHASATEVRVSISLSQRGFVLRLSDNGRGFDPARESIRQRPEGGHGLRNMRARLEQLGGTCRIHSDPNSGTAIEFVIHLRN